MRRSSTLVRLGLGVVIAAAGLTATPALAGAASTCTFSPNTVPARVDVYDGSGDRALVVSRSGSSITITDLGFSSKTCAGPTGDATVFNTDQIIVHGNTTKANDEFVVQSMGPGRTPESDGTSELETVVNNARPSFLTVWGTAGADIMRVTGGGGVMAGRDADVDVRDFSATDIAVLGLGGADYLSGRGGSPASIPGPATARVAMVGGDGDDTLIDGPLAGDELSGEGGNDTLFSFDSNALDHTVGGAGFDQATIDDGDFHTSDIESVKVVG